MLSDGMQHLAVEIIPACRLRQLLFFLLCMALSNLQAQSKILEAGMKISASVKIATGVYTMNATSGLFAPVIEIEGNNIVVDFNNATLNGNRDGSMPDKFFGTAISIKAGKNITIKNLTARGYKVALKAEGTEGLVIEHCDFSYNYRQRLNSTQQKEDLGDWMSYHHNEKDEWLRYGAAIYLRGCNKAVVHDNTVTGGQCALMLTQCDSGVVYNNNFFFNSGIGIGMYRSSENQIIQNKLDFNVRGHSEGVYNRGQDAAAILVFEQCNKNVFAYNSATHSGDGFFLWAGQTTMDSGEGGCNDNLIYKNDFSYAPTNGIEVTFSRNRIFGNIIKGCDNGVWGGYSYQTKIWRNNFEKNKIAVAIEHGQYNEILFNEFLKDETAIKLWAKKQSPPDWGYSKSRDTKSKAYFIAGNRFKENNKPISITYMDSLEIGLNEYTGCGKNLVVGDFVNALDSLWNNKELLKLKYDSAVETGIPLYIKPQTLQVTGEAALDRRQIRMTEWGPYDFKSPLIWNTNPVSKSDTMQFEIIGPKGYWKIIQQRGVKNISSAKGIIPATISAIKTIEKGEDVFIELEYTGENIIGPFGEKVVKGKRYHFNYRNALVPVNWLVNWYGFDSINNPIKNPALVADLVKQVPLLTENSTGLDYAWWTGVGNDRKQEQFLTVAASTIDVPAGDYELGVSWEDVVRIYIDGQLLLDEWKPAQYAYDESRHRDLPVKLGGQHHIRAEQANQQGFATLIIKLKKK